MAARSFLPRPPKLPKARRQAEEQQQETLWEHCGQARLESGAQYFKGGGRGAPNPRAQVVVSFCYEVGRGCRATNRRCSTGVAAEREVPS